MTLFEKVFEKYGIVIGKTLWGSQIEELQFAFDSLEHGEKVELNDSFVQLTFDLIVCDLRWQKRKKEGMKNEE